MIVSEYLKKILTNHVAVLMGGILLFYIPLVFSFPILYNDDYYIFYKISLHPGMPITLDQAEKFFLFLRPVSYFYFWLQYTLFYDSALLMKMFGMVVNLAAAVFLFLTIKKAKDKFHVSIDISIVSVLCLAAAVHRDFAHGILWISNMNELLAVFFYILTFYFLLSDISRMRNVILSFVCFLLSLLAKQQGLHLPLLLMLYYFTYRQDIPLNERKNLLFLIVSTLTVSIILAAANFIVYLEGSDIALVDTLWKKPFSILGTIFYMVFPVFGREIYNYFLVQKTMAIGLFIFLVLAAAVLFMIYRKRLKNSLRYVLFSILVVSIIFFPRILAGGGERLNGIQLVWLTAVFAFLLSAIQKKYALVLVVLLLVQNAFSSMMLSHGLWEQEHTVRQLISDIRQYQVIHRQPLCIVPSVSKMWNIPYITELTRTGKYGADSTIVFTDVLAYNPMLYSFDRDISVSRNQNFITVRAANQSATYLMVHMHSFLTILGHTKSNIRGYSEITFQLPDSLASYQVLQYDGKRLVEK